MGNEKMTIKEFDRIANKLNKTARTYTDFKNYAEQPKTDFSKEETKSMMSEKLNGAKIPLKQEYISIINNFMEYINKEEIIEKIAFEVIKECKTLPYEESMDNIKKIIIPKISLNKIAELYRHIYLLLVDRLLHTDLSLIPEEKWNNDLMLFNHPSNNLKFFDFSRTHANIDFSLINVPNNCAFYGCNLKNLRIYEENNIFKLNLDYNKLDNQFISRNSGIFLTANFPDELRKKICDKNLTPKDVINLYSYQLKEIKGKFNLTEIMDKRYANLINHIGIDNFIKCCDRRDIEDYISGFNLACEKCLKLK